MQSWVRRASRAGSFAGGCVLLFAVGASTSASAQGVYSGIFGQGVFGVQGQGQGQIQGQGQPVTPLIDTRDFSVTPMAGLQETFTDNALLTSTNKQYDFITRPMLGADVNVHGPFEAKITGHVYYDAYVNNGQLDGVSGDAQATGTYALIPNFLSIDANGLLTNTNVSTFGTSAINRVGTANQAQLSTFDIGPRLTTTLDDFADLNVMGRFAEVSFGSPSGSTIGIPQDSTILEGSATIDTGTRYRGYQAVTTALVERDDHGFQAYGGEQSFFVAIFPQVRLIARGGYDNVSEPRIVNISAPVWSAGAEFTINQLSTISVETGERYNHSAWAADMHLQLFDHLYALGRYTEVIQPNQLQINSAFESFIAPVTPLPVQLTNNVFAVNGNLDNQTALAKLASLDLVYEWQTQSVSLTAAWNDRLLLGSNSHDRSLVSGINYNRNIAPDLNFTTSVDYYRTFANPFFGASESYYGSVGLQYAINSTMRAVGGYAYEHQIQLFTNGQSISENVAYAAVVKQF
jgi:uncharacterized protein (PEP-CTERM system associated)